MKSRLRRPAAFAAAGCAVARWSGATKSDRRKEGSDGSQHAQRDHGTRAARAAVAAAAPAVDVDGLRLATSDLVQHGLARHAEQLRGPDDRLPLARSGKAVRNSPRD